MVLTLQEIHDKLTQLLASGINRNTKLYDSDNLTFAIDEIYYDMNLDKAVFTMDEVEENNEQ
jgi:hypothetical protein